MNGRKVVYVKEHDMTILEKEKMRITFSGIHTDKDTYKTKRENKNDDNHSPAFSGTGSVVSLIFKFLGYVGREHDITGLWTRERNTTRIMSKYTT